jgi:hypothetical protein
MITGNGGFLQDRSRKARILSEDNTTDLTYLTHNIVFNIMTTKRGTKMAEDLQAIELQKIYQQADAECRKKIVEAAAQLLNAQKSLKNTPDVALKNEEC